MRNKLTLNIDRFSKKWLRGYSLVEISIVLLIIGIVTTAILKGRALIESTRLDTAVNDMRSIQLAYGQYIDSYAAIPGNDSDVNHLQNVETGKGDGKFVKEDANRMFSHLNAVGLIENENFKIPKIGKGYKIIEVSNHPYIKLEGLTKEQINLFKTKLTATFGTTIDIKNDESSVSIQID